MKRAQRKAKVPAVVVPDEAQRDRRWRVAATVLLLGLGAVLLFARLGHYALWDDEAMVALVGSNVWQTGDTGIQVGHNLVVYRGGALLSGLHDRSTPPFSAYLAAPMIGLCGGGTFVLRFPFALFGWGTLAFIAWWLWRARPGGALHPVLAVALLANAAMLLFFRQCRYYAPATFFTVTATALYLRWRGDGKGALALAGAIVALFVTNYMSCVVLLGCLLVDYLLWRRHELRPRGKALLALLLPVGLACTAVALVWNPFRTGFGSYLGGTTLAERATLLWWNVRDVNRGELCVLLLVLAAPVVGRLARRAWLTRGGVAFLVYLVLVTLVSPQVVRDTTSADVRYLAPLIPLGCLLGAGVIDFFLGQRRWLAVAVAAAIFGSNLLHGGPLLSNGVSLTCAKLVRELLHPPSDPYTAAAAWVNRNVPEMASLWVTPEHTRYPLMYHAPGPRYAWQLANPPPRQFAGVPDLHIRHKVPPDYMLAFGPGLRDVVAAQQRWSKRGVEYQRAAVIDHHWQDGQRPELFWHAFEPVRDFDRDHQAIYAFRRIR